MNKRSATALIKHAFFGDALSIVLTCLTLLFVIYYFAVGMFAGFRMSILYIWPFFSGCICVYLMIRELIGCGMLALPKWMIATFYTLFFICLAFFLFVEGCIISGFFSSPPESLDYIILLGAKVNGESPSLALENRIDAAYEYLANNKNTLCIASGGQGDDEMISEAECISRELIRRGIDEKRIILEDRSTSTSENLKFSAEMIGDTSKNVAVVTNNFHVFRGMALARKCGIRNIYGISADLPSILLPHYLIREFIAVTVDTIYQNTSFI